jgi:hypothetical protein
MTTTPATIHPSGAEELWIKYTKYGPLGTTATATAAAAAAAAATTTTEHYTILGGTSDYVLAPENGIIMQELRKNPTKYNQTQQTFDHVAMIGDDFVLSKDLADLVLKGLCINQPCKWRDEDG